MVNMITGEEAECSVDMPEYFKNPETPEAQEYFRRVEEENKAEQIARFEKRFRSCGANRKDIEDAGFDKAVWLSKNQVELFNICKEFVDKLTTDESFNKTLVLCGTPGAGKTFFALSTLRMLCGREKEPLHFVKEYIQLDEEGNVLPEMRKEVQDSNIRDFWSGLYTTSEELAEVMDMKFKDSYEKSEQKAKLRQWKKTKLLVIDEIGRANIQELTERNNLFSIINARQSNYLATILCTNFESEALHKVCGDALWERIKGNGRIISMRDFDNMRAPDKQQKIKEWRNRNEK